MVEWAAARLAGIERVADSGLWGSPWCDGKEEGAKGVLTMGKRW
jgi:hypothetical protein